MQKIEFLNKLQSGRLSLEFVTHTLVTCFLYKKNNIKNKENNVSFLFL